MDGQKGWAKGVLGRQSIEVCCYRLLLGRGGDLGKVIQRVASPGEGSCQCLSLGEDTLAGHDCTRHALRAETSFIE